MTQDQYSAPRDKSNVVSLNKAVLRKRVTGAIAAAIEQWAPIVTSDARKQMIDLDINVSQIIYGMRRAEIVDFDEDAKYPRLLFTARLLSAGEEFFVSAGVEPVVPFFGAHVVIKRVWR